MCDGFLWKRMKIGQIKGMISRRMLILSYTIKVKSNVCTKLQNPRFHRSWEIFWHKLPYVLHLSDRWKKEKNENKSQSLAFLLHNRLQPSVCAKFEDSSSHSTWEISVTKTFIGKKETWTTKENKNEDAYSLLYNTNSCTQCLYQISKS